jgi:uncharacterized membrane protein
MNSLTYFKKESKNVAAIRDTLRKESSPSLTRRRKIIALSAIGALDFTIISLYQTGIIRRLPDLPLKVLDSNAVNASEKAYKTGLPDGTSGTTMYGVIMMLAAYGGKRGIGRNRMVDLALLSTVLAGSAGALQYLYDMAFKQKKACLYCLAGAVVNFMMVPLAWAGVKRTYIT